MKMQSQWAWGPWGWQPTYQDAWTPASPAWAMSYVGQVAEYADQSAAMPAGSYAPTATATGGGTDKLWWAVGAAAVAIAAVIGLRMLP